MPTQATYDDANLILRLYELRREEKLREARTWFAQNCKPTSLEDMNRIAPPGSQENAYMRMVASYWETAASFVTSGVLNRELFFESSGEMLVVWERLRAIVPALRALMKNPSAFHNLETVGNAYIQWMQSQGPEAYAGFQAMLASMGAPQERHALDVVPRGEAAHAV
ncbi:MAG TPA: hypothetical protein VMH81_35170 [Bryobacteraceae bacterium]|nr:hypothetical protein [Bryobacteraceae bacterium]